MDSIKFTPNLFDKVVEAAPSGMIMIDDQGKILMVNLQTEKLFGYTRQDLLGERIEILVPDRYRASHPGLRNNFFKAPKSRAMGAGRELFGKKKDGGEFPIEIGLNPLEVEGRLCVLASVIDITERKRAEGRFQLAVEAAPNAMLMVDREGKIVMANKQTEKLFRYEKNQLLGKPLEVLVPERFRAKHPGLRMGFMSDPRVRAMGAGRDLFGQTSTGEEVPIEIGLTPIETEKEMFVLASIIDITERKKNEQLISAREAALEASRIKSQFLATMSHEIRTPLNGIIGLTNLLFEMELGPQQKELLSGIQLSADSLLSLINDILDLSKIEADKMDFEVVNFNLEQVIADSVSVSASGARQKGLRIDVLVDPDIPRWLKGDAAKIKQIFMNLLSNAVKFTWEGSISVRARKTPSGQSASTVLIEVEDTGVGITDSVRERLFEVFTQGDSSTRRKYGGTGLGLSISKRLVVKMGGQIGVESEVGRGSRFWFHLPLSVGEEVFAAEPGPRKKIKTPRPDFRILVAEDNIINQKVALGALKSMGLQGQAVGNGIEALELLKDFSFDLILMDCHMPEMDGYEATQRIRAEGAEKLRKIPIIAMTANVMQGDRERCLEVGMNDYVAKPIDRDELERVLDKWVNAVEYDQQLGGQVKSAIEKVKSQYGEGMVGDLIRTYLEVTPAALSTLQKALAAADYKTLLREAHSLKSTSLIMGCQNLSTQAAAAETACREQKYGLLPGLVEAVIKIYSETKPYLEDELKRQNLTS